MARECDCAPGRACLPCAVRAAEEAWPTPANENAVRRIWYQVHDDGRVEVLLPRKPTGEEPRRG